MTFTRALYLACCFIILSSATTLPHVPKDPPLAFQWLSPTETLSQIEKLPSMSMMAPPNTKPGWIWKMLTSRHPMLKDIRIDKPIWGQLSSFTEKDPDATIVLHVKGAAKNLVEFLSKSGASGTDYSKRRATYNFN